MAGNPRLHPGADPQKFPRCQSRPGDGGQTVLNPAHSVENLSRLAVAFLSPGSGYAFMLTSLLQFQAQDQKIPSILAEDFTSSPARTGVIASEKLFFQR